MPKHQSPNVAGKEGEELLRFKYMNVLALKVMGFKYEDIAQKTGYSYGYIKRLFMSGGKLHALAKQFREVAQRESVDEAMDHLYGNLPDVARTMVTTANLPFDPSGVMAGRTVFEYTLGKPTERDKGAGGMGSNSFAEWAYEQTEKMNDGQATGAPAQIPEKAG